jgi:huntingtin
MQADNVQNFSFLNTGSVSSTLDDIDTLSLISQQDSGIEEPLSEMSVDGASEKGGESGMSVADIQELRRHFSQPEDEISETMTDTVSEVSDDGTEGSSSLPDTDNSSMLGHHRSGSNTSGIVTQASSTDELDRIETEQDMIAKDNQGSELEEEENEGVEEGFDIDPVVCQGVPILHCARVMCSLLLSGKNGEILSDRLVRVSVKSLALNCLAAIFRIHPPAFLMHVVPEVDDEGINGDGNQQLIREILLYQGHHDPIIRGSLGLLVGSLMQSSLKRSK